MPLKRGTEVATIDVNMITIKPSKGGDEIMLQTASKIAVSVQTETTESVKLVIKGVLKAQKPEVTTITGNQIILTDNVFIPEVVKILQGGTIKYWTSEEHTESSETPSEFGIASYAPPASGSGEKGEVFELCAYSAEYDSSGQIVKYEKITYPNCQGVPVALSSEDNVFRVTEYTINSAPKAGQPPYLLEYVDELPTVA